MKDIIGNLQTKYSFLHEGAKRFLTAMSGVPDRIPVYAQMHELAMKESGANAKKFYTTPEVLVTSTLELMEKFCLDVPYIVYDVYNIEAEALGQKILYSDNGIPDIDRSQPLIRDKDDLKKIKTPNFESDGRFANVIEMHRIFRKLTGGTKPAFWFCGPFTLAANIRGIEQLLMDLYNEPDLAKNLLDRVTEEVLAPWILRLKKEFIDGKVESGSNDTAHFPALSPTILGADAIASIPIVSPSILKEWVVPYVSRLRELCGPEVCVFNWVGERNLKNPGEMIDLKLEASQGFIIGQDPDVEVLGPAFYKRYAEKKGIPLVLGIGAVFMVESTPKEVADRVKHYVEVGGENGRFALYLCNLGATTPAENIRAAIDAAHRYGTYKT
jgi:uroporphyrinogen-III decarboxylase